ncbi:MAG: GspE/PulE family protein [Acidimicrobiales bacterium]
MAPERPPRPAVPATRSARRLAEARARLAEADIAPTQPAAQLRAVSNGHGPAPVPRRPEPVAAVAPEVMTERARIEALGAQHRIPVVDLRHQTPHRDALALLPEHIARELVAVPVRQVPGGLEIAVADVPSSTTQARLAEAVRMRVGFVLAPETDIRRVIDASYRAIDRIDSHIQAFEAAVSARNPADVGAADRAAEPDAPVVEVVNAIVTQALRDRASDIHIEPQGDRVRVRYRVDGTLSDVLSLPSSMGPTLVNRIKIMAGMNIVERRRSQDGQFATVIDGRDLDVRVATGATIRGETAVLRLLDKSRSLYKLGQLGIPPDSHAVLSRLVRSPFGMVVCAGPTGSGKTTTLYAALAEINTVERNIMTIEDPVEYIVPGLNQQQINQSADVTFAYGLKAILRQDPDVILVGEMRDAETARIAVQSALTGHLVLSSLHATDAVSALLRFLDMGIENFLVASSLLAVVGQRLVRQICEACKAPYQPSSQELTFYREADSKPKNKFWHGEGCNFCAHTGYQDRMGVYEVLVLDEGIRKLVVQGADAEKLRAHALRNGMRTLLDEGLRLVDEDVTTISEILRTIYVA